MPLAYRALFPYRRRVAAAFAALIAAGLGSAPAYAGQALAGGSVLTYNARSGETNRVTIVQDPYGATVTDTAGVTSTNCERTVPAVPTRMFCPIVPSPVATEDTVSIVVRLGDGSDHLVYRGRFPVTVYDGPGNDYVSLGWGNDDWRNGPGNDSFYGHGGGDYARRVAAGVRYGLGSDRLNGGPGSDLLEGGPGTDRLYGGWGDDNLTGGAGLDRMLGGRGVDLIDGVRIDFALQ